MSATRDVRTSYEIEQLGIVLEIQAEVRVSYRHPNDPANNSELLNLEVLNDDEEVDLDGISIDGKPLRQIVEEKVWDAA